MIKLPILFQRSKTSEPLENLDDYKQTNASAAIKAFVTSDYAPEGLKKRFVVPRNAAG